MSDDAPQKPSGDFDVVMLNGATEDGQGARVVRARPGRVEAAEVRPMTEGKPLVAGEIVRLEPRPDAPTMFDVHVQHVVKPADARAKTPSTDVKGHAGPAQVATDEYRDSWDRTFGERRPRALN
jgi:hypothetical protein